MGWVWKVSFYKEIIDGKGIHHFRLLCTDNMDHPKYPSKFSQRTLNIFGLKRYIYVYDSLFSIKLGIHFKFRHLKGSDVLTLKLGLLLNGK